MPFHGTELLDPTIERWLRLCAPVETALDVGTGAGWRGRQMRAAFREARIIGYETEHDYVKMYDLNAIYSMVRVTDVMELLDSDGTEHYDVVFLGDVIEHLRKSDGVDLLHYLVYRTRHLFVCYPERYPQDAWEGHISEAHRSAWEKSDFSLYEPLWTARAEKSDTPGVAIAVLLHGFGYLATDEDLRRFSQRFGNGVAVSVPGENGKGAPSA